MIITRHDIEQQEQRYRTAFVNSLAGFRQAVLVGSKGADGSMNLAIFNSLIHLGANPALFGLINRPDTVPRDTLRNIRETGEYSLNYVHASQFEKAHQTSARYEHGVSEFEMTGLEAMFYPDHVAPFVTDAVVKICMTLEEIIPIPINGTVLIIGSIAHVDIDTSVVGSDGFVSLSDAEVLVSQGLDAYFIAKLVGRLPYASI
ncbi:MAG: flavin reductase [Candidatus Kapabacteria bacterium]|nr:flavin reductase [Candidatus Kapabacteria bacterium]